MRPAAESAPTGDVSRREVALTLASVLLVLLLAALDQTIVGTAMPRIIGDLGGFERYAWVTTAYMLTSTTIVPIVGKLSDMFGRRRFYMGGLLIFLGGSALAGAAPDLTMLIAFRAIQGIGAGIVMAIAFIVIGDLFPPAQRGRIQGLFAAVFGLAALIGPPLGGYLTDSLSWRWSFYVNLPLGVVALVIVGRFFPRIRPPARVGPIDWAGAVTLAACVTPLLLALSWGGRERSWSDPLILGLFGLSAAMLVACIAIERRAAEPIIPPAIVRDPVIRMAILASFFTSVGMFGTILYVPLFVQAVLGASATASGSALLPMMFGMVGASIVSGWLISHSGRYRPAALVGLGLMTIGLILLSRLEPSSSLATTGAMLAVVGAGLGAVFPVFTIAVQNAAPPELLGAATSSAQFFRQIGGTVGAAALGGWLGARSLAALESQLAPMRPSLEAALAADGTARALVANPGALLDAAGRGPLPVPPIVADAVRTALSQGLTEVFLIGAVAVLAAFAAASLMPERPLRRGRFAARAADPTAP